MWPDRVSNPGPLAYESGALLTAQHDPAHFYTELIKNYPQLSSNTPSYLEL